MDIEATLPQPDTWNPETTELYRAHYTSLVRGAAYRLNDHGLAEQVVQDVFARFAQGVSVASGCELAYLRCMVRNAVTEHIRRAICQREKYQQLAAGQLGQSVDISTGIVDSALVTEALSALPRQQRRVISARYLLDLSVQETAESLGMSAGSVKTHTHRALARLREVTRPAVDAGTTTVAA